MSAPSKALLATATCLAAASAQAADSLLAAQPVLAAGAVALALVALGGIVARNRSLRREIELERRGRHQESEARQHLEERLKLTREELGTQLRLRESELELASTQLAELQARLDTANERLGTLARIDALTGVANRRRFEEALDDEIKRMVRDRNPLSLILCEIDFYDAYAASYGVKRGNEALVKVAAAIDALFKRAGDLVARYGPTKFAVILPATDSQVAARFAQRLQKTVFDLCIPHDGSEAADRMTVSTGIATMRPNKLHRSRDLVEAVEIALDQARRGGRNCAESAILS